MKSESFLFLLVFFTGIVSHAPLGSRKYYLIQQAKTWSDAQAYCRASYTDLAIIKDSNDMDRFMDEAQKQNSNAYSWIGMYLNVNTWHWSYANEPLGLMTNWAPNEPNNWGGREECGVLNTNDWNDKPCMSMFPYMCSDGGKSGFDKFVYFANATTWLGAQTFCRQYYSDLATIATVTDNVYVKSVVNGFTWIGLVRDSWKWIDHSNLSTVPWRSGQPDNFMLNQNCGCIMNGQVDDGTCTDALPFFCFSDVTKRKQSVRLKVQSTEDVNAPGVKEAISEQIMQKLKEHMMSENVLLKWRENPGGNVFDKENAAESVNSGTCERYV